MALTIDTAFLDTMPANVAVQFFDRVAASPDSEAFRFPRGEAWESVTWKQAGDRVEALAAGLIALGVEPEQRVGIASGTRYEWILADLGDHVRRAVRPRRSTRRPTPRTSPTSSPTPRAASSSPRTTSSSPSSPTHRAELPHVSKVVTFDGTADGDWVITLDDLAELGEAQLAEQPDVVDGRRRRRSRPTSSPP